MNESGSIRTSGDLMRAVYGDDGEPALRMLVTIARLFNREEILMKGLKRKAMWAFENGLHSRIAMDIMIWAYNE